MRLHHRRMCCWWRVRRGGMRLRLLLMPRGSIRMRVWRLRKTSRGGEVEHRHQQRTELDSAFHDYCDFPFRCSKDYIFCCD